MGMLVGNPWETCFKGSLRGAVAYKDFLVRLEVRRSLDVDVVDVLVVVEVNRVVCKVDQDHSFKARSCPACLL